MSALLATRPSVGRIEYKYAVLKRQFVAALQSGPLTKADILDRLGIGESVFETLVKDLRDDGVLIYHERYRTEHSNTVMWKLTSPAHEQMVTLRDLVETGLLPEKMANYLRQVHCDRARLRLSSPSSRYQDRVKALDAEVRELRSALCIAESQQAKLLEELRDTKENFTRRREIPASKLAW